MTPDPVVYGPTDESRRELYSGFAMSSADWSRRADEAAERGDTEKARAFAAVARVADSVARGGMSCS